MVKFFQVVIAISAVCAPLTSSAALFRDLKLGDSGADVRELQTILNTNIATQVAPVGLGSPGNETDYFGAKTHAAVVRYQNMYRTQVLAPIGLRAGTGYVGALTRAHILQSTTQPKEVTQIELPTPTTQDDEPVIEYVTPTFGPPGTEVTLVGRGFKSHNDVRASFAFLQDVPSEDGTTITFIAESPFPDEIGALGFLKGKGLVIPYGFYIEDGNKRSNTVVFDVHFE